ncbi:hypothetical protein DFH06DRAFT_1133652 [Mycena polygramma]|nr:hypothetical protein DFH06DRAFT_1133652 [Mycena polygramma]
MTTVSIRLREDEYGGLSTPGPYRVPETDTEEAIEETGPEPEDRALALEEREVEEMFDVSLAGEEGVGVVVGSGEQQACDGEEERQLEERGGRKAPTVTAQAVLAINP